MSYQRRWSDNFEDSLNSYHSNKPVSDTMSTDTFQCQYSEESHEYIVDVKTENIEKNCNIERKDINFSNSELSTCSTNSALNKTIDLSLEEMQEVIDLTDNNGQEVIDLTYESVRTCKKEIKMESNETFISAALENLQLTESQTSNVLDAEKIENVEYQTPVLSKKDIVSEQQKSCDSLSRMSVSSKNDMRRSIFMRLSQEFQKQPISFTERLMTILEESLIDTLVTNEIPNISLNRLTEEFAKMYKLIEDESMPEWAPSFNASMLDKDHTNAKKCQIDNENRSDGSTPQCFKSSKTNKNGTPRKLFKTIITNAHQSPHVQGTPRKNVNCCSQNSTPCKDVNDTDTFEFWEKFCDELYSNETPTNIQTCAESLPTLNSSATSIYTICERQMASLENDSFNQSEKSKSPTTNSSSKGDESTSGADYYTPQGSSIENHSLIHDTNEFEMTLMQEIRRRRQRCLDTAKLMEEIDNEVAPENQNAENFGSPRHAVVKSHLLDILMRCTEYKDILMDKNNLQNAFNKETEKSPCEVKNVNSVNSKNIHEKGLSNLKKKDVTKNAHAKIENKRSNDQRHLVNSADKKSQHLSNRKKLSPSRVTNFVTPSRRLSMKQTKVVNPLTLSSRKFTSVENLNKSPMKKTPSELLSKKKNTQKNLLRPVDTYHLPRTSSNVNPKKRLLQKKITSPKPCTEAITTEENVTRTPMKDFCNLAEPKKFEMKKFLSPSKTPSAIEEKVENVNKLRSPETDSQCTFFVTPGKTAARRVRKKPSSYFSDPPELSGKKANTPYKSPKISESKYQDVISPLRTYINYTNTNLLQNVRSKINDMLLTPANGECVDSLQFKLSPKLSKVPVVKVSAVDENEDPVVPHVVYNRPQQVQIIKEPKRNFGCRTILEPIDNKVVLRHEGRVRTPGKESKGNKFGEQMSDNFDDNAETSILVEKAARRAY